MKTQRTSPIKLRITYHDNASVLTYGETLGIALENMVTQLERSGMVLNDETSQRILG